MLLMEVVHLPSECQCLLHVPPLMQQSCLQIVHPMRRGKASERPEVVCTN